MKKKFRLSPSLTDSYSMAGDFELANSLIGNNKIAGLTFTDMMSYGVLYEASEETLTFPTPNLDLSMTTPIENVSYPWDINPGTKLKIVTGRPQEQIIYSRQIYFVSRGYNVFYADYERMLPPKFNLGKWANQSFERYVMFNSRSVMGLFGKGDKPEDFVFVDISASYSTIDISVNGTMEKVEEFSAWLDTQGFSQKEIMVEWSFGKDHQNMNTYSLPLKVQPEIPGAYPWMKESIQDYTNRFMGSRESVLVLKGPPGTGKTSFIKALIKHSGNSALVTYDQGLLFSDGFFADFLVSDSTSILVVEDADSMLIHRKDDNPVMDRLLNTSDGLVSMARKKIVFSTNLGSINSIDAALLREGRCFDVMEFRRYTFEEAKEIAGVLYGPEFVLPEKKNGYSLAEVTNLDRTTRVAMPIKEVGFRIG